MDFVIIASCANKPMRTIFFCLERPHTAVGGLQLHNPIRKSYAMWWLGVWRTLSRPHPYVPESCGDAVPKTNPPCTRLILGHCGFVDVWIVPPSASLTFGWWPTPLTAPSHHIDRLSQPTMERLKTMQCVREVVHLSCIFDRTTSFLNVLSLI